MFSLLGDKLTKVFNKLKGKGYLSESDISTAMREIRIALLEADVALPAVKHLVERVKERALGKEVIKSITPGQMVVKIVKDELVEILGSKGEKINLGGSIPAVIMLVGLQGSGKTTTAAKLALQIRKKSKKKILMVSLDVYRPAAQDQLEVLGKQIMVDTFPIIESKDVLKIYNNALEYAKYNAYDIIILDTAGRLHIDQALMDELKSVKELYNPSEIILVADSMTGQDAVNIGKEFHGAVDLDSIILTRVDGDARGGAALSIRYITGCPIKYLGVGEKSSDLEEFSPDRVASRILGMGDVVTLVEKASEAIDEVEAEKIASKMQKGSFDMNDLLAQLKNLKRMGGFTSILGMIPGLGGIKKQIDSANFDKDVLKYQEAIIMSMTYNERANPKILDASRKNRIAKGSGTSVQEINKLIKQFLEMQRMVKKVSGLDPKNMKNKIERMLNAKTNNRL